MKKLLLVLVVFSFLSFKNSEKNVFICDSGGAKRYHYTETCRGLQACKHTLIKSTESKALASGLTLYKWEE